jgi:hypothetical protein
LRITANGSAVDAEPLAQLVHERSSFIASDELLAFTRLEPDDLEEFVDRWPAGWPAPASGGLGHPLTMRDSPEGS